MGSEAKFKVGDRVRFTHKCNAGWWFGPNTKYTTGVIRRGNSNDWSVECSNGNTAYVLHNNQMELIHAPLTIEAGKFYMTRDGRRVGPMARYYANSDYPWQTPGGFLIYKNDGTNYDAGSKNDLIAEAPTPTYTANAAAEVDNLADEYGGGKPRFKVGDRVQVSNHPYFLKDNETAGTIIGESDGRGKWSVNLDNYDDSLNFLESEMALATTSAIVALIENGQPKPSHLPYVHTTRASAETEAKRLAGKHKGKEFGVYELLSTIKEEPVYEHEWQRLAASGNAEGAVVKLSKVAGLDRTTAQDAVKDWYHKHAA